VLQNRERLKMAQKLQFEHQLVTDQ